MIQEIPKIELKTRIYDFIDNKMNERATMHQLIRHCWPILRGVSNGHDAGRNFVWALAESGQLVRKRKGKFVFCSLPNSGEKL